MLKLTLHFWVSILAATIPLQAASPVIISEFMANNGNTLSDENGDKSDWIELYNGSTNTVNLAGWYLTDTTNNLREWQFPSVNLAPNSYLVVFASGKDRRNPSSPLHTNFKLNNDGEYLALVLPDGTNVASEFTPKFPLQAADVSYGFAGDAHDVTLVTTGTVARALVPTNDSLALTWTELGFPDQTWTNGTVGVGYDRNPSGVDYTPMLGLNVDSNMFNLNQTVYIRVPFVVTNVAEIDTLTLTMLYDDGFIAFLNGHEIARDNAPSPATYNSGAPANRPDGTAIIPTNFNVTAYRDFLQVGQNVLAIQGLNNGIGSSDLLILPQLVGRTRSSGYTMLRYFPVPTPGAVNNNGVDVLGPIITELQHTPSLPQDHDDLLVTAKVRPTFSAVSSVVLHYRIMYNAETNLTMFDDGQHGDGGTNDGVFAATIPASTSTPGQMIRWFVTATDSSNAVSRFPSYLDPLHSPQYDGTMVAVSETNNLPVLYWFVQTPSAADNTTGTRASLFYLGEFYDNVAINLHGQSSSGFPKKSYDIDFHRGYNFRYALGEKRVDDINLLTTYPDKAHMRNVLAYETFRDAGSPYHFVVPVRVHQNGTFFSDAHLVENGDENYLDRLGMDVNGALYKMYNTLNAATGEKKTRKNEGTDDLQALINGSLLPPGPARNAYLYDNINVPECINYLAANTLTGNTDCCHKNYYLYRDTEGTGEWQILPWDVDLSFGRVWSSSPTYWDDVLYANTPLFVGNNNTLMTALFNTPEIRQMYLRRVRTLMDDLLQPPGTPSNQGRYEHRIDQLVAAIAPDAALDLAKWGTWCCSGAGPYTQATIPVPANYQTMSQAADLIKFQYLPARRTFLYTNQVVGGGGEIPLTYPGTPTVTIGAIEYSPASSNQLQEYIEVKNPNSYWVDVSGWRITGGVDFTFAPGTVIPANTTLYVSPDVRAFRARTTGPRGGQGLFVQGPYSGQLSARGETINIINRAGQVVASQTYLGNPSVVQKFLRITEIMYHPSPLAGNTNSPEEFEYIELKNVGPVGLDLNGVRLTNGVSFEFAGSLVTNLAPGETVLVVKNATLFTARYGTGFSIAGQYTGSLDNAGERLRLLDSVGEEILDFAYNNTWYPITDGLGFSLVVVDEQANPDAWNQKANWRASSALLGSPGQVDPPARSFSPVLVNEALTRTVTVPDAIELYNPGTNGVDLGGWYLTDDFTVPNKFRIPNGTIISAGGYRVFTEMDFNATPGVPPSFSLGADGDEVYLFGTDTNGNLNGYVHGFDFGAAESEVTFGRYVTSQGKEHFVAQTTNTLNGANSGPKVGPIVISEIMYHSRDIGTNDNTADEFIELLNITTNTVALFDPNLPTNTWKITGDADFAFPTNLSLAPGESVLVLSINPTNNTLLNTFRSNFGVETNVRVFGPWSGHLNNDSGRITLRKPTAPIVTAVETNIPYAAIDTVEYEDSLPWPKTADGIGFSLQRWIAGAYGNDPINWVSTRPTPGTSTVTNGTPPQITAQPQGRTVLVGQTMIVTATVTGSGPLAYQWLLNGTNLPGATNLSLQVTNVQPKDAGDYELIVFNIVGSTSSQSAKISVRFPVIILQQPQSVDVRVPPDPAAAPTTNVTFTVSSASVAPMTYQWRRNGSVIPDATNNTFTINGVKTNDYGYFSVVISDDVSSVETTNFWLYPLVSPNFVESPLAQSVVVGGKVTLSAQVTGWPPPFTFEWRLGSSILLISTQEESISFFTFTAPTNVTSQGYRTIVRNRALPSGRASSVVSVNTLADSDGDGIPDQWELAYGMSPSNSVNRLLDTDGDGMLDWQEYLADTDPTNALSNLKITSMTWSNSALRMQFSAVSNKTYAVQYLGSLSDTNWQSLARIPGRRTNHVEIVLDPVANTNRFYRVVTPSQ